MKLILVANAAFTLLNFRRELMTSLVSQGFEVIAMCPSKCNLMSANISKEFECIGLRYIPIDFQRNGLNIISDLKFLFELYRVFKGISPDYVLNYTIKPFVYGSIAAKLSGGVKVLSNVTGLGYIFTENTLKTKLLRMLISLQLKAASMCNNVVFFQNPDDLADYAKFGIINGSQETKVINGSGVNIEKFAHTPAPENNPVHFLFIARLIKDKGIYELIDAARQVRETYPDAVVDIVGPLDSNPNSLSISEVDKLQNDGVVNYHGPTDDVQGFLKRCDVFVLPSYREGTPRTVLEALAIGRPIITTDAPGCRECVNEGENGFLVPVKDSHELSLAMEKLIISPKLRIDMGLSSRKIAEKKYDVNLVIKDIIDAIQKC